MKFAISSNGRNKNDLMDTRFGRCSYFVIYDSETEKYSAIDNEAATAGGGAGIAAAQAIIDENIQVLITGNLGPNAYKLFNNSNIKVYSCDNKTIEEVITAYKNNELDLISEAGKAHQGMR